MAVPEEIVVDISPQGKVKMEGFGFHGGKCEVVMGELENALGTVASVQLKPEYHEKVHRGEKISNR